MTPRTNLRGVIGWLWRNAVDDVIELTPARLTAAIELTARYSDPGLAVISRHAEVCHRDFWAQVDRQQAARRMTGQASPRLWRVK